MSETTTTAALGSSSHLTRKQRKEKFEALGALQTQLDVSVTLARTKVASWLSADGFSDDEEDQKASGSGSSFVAASELKARQPGLGLGAKYISHKDAMRHVPLNAFESKLKRQLTGSVVASEIEREKAKEKNALPDKYQEHKLMMAARRKELQEQQEEEEDSKTRTIAASTSHSIHNSGSSTGATANDSTKHSKKNKKGFSAKVHPAAVAAEAISSSLPSKTTTTSHVVPQTPKPSSQVGAAGRGKKRMGDFFSTYMDERAGRLANKKKKSHAKADSDDD
ncbi:hypothetical protein BGZ94_006181 [Podila epigama]|nr:hypothetical protein BGZ94_006181 [Podila epigama]